MAKASHYMVRDSFIGRLKKGVEVEYHKGEVVDASDGALKKWPQNFEELVVRGGNAVEQATAAPGEKRRLPLRRPARKAAPAKAKAEPEPSPEPEPEPTPEPEAQPEAAGEQPEGKAMTLAGMKGQ